VLLPEWEQWYSERNPEAIDNATERVYGMITLFKDAILKTAQETVRNCIEELVIIKTFSGLRFQEAILKKVAFTFQQSLSSCKTCRGVKYLAINRPLLIIS